MRHPANTRIRIRENPGLSPGITAPRPPRSVTRPRQGEIMVR